MDWRLLIGALACVTLGWMLHGCFSRGLTQCVLALHEHAFRLYWRWRSRHRGGRPRLEPELIALIQRMSLDNPLWGAPRIHGELLLLGYEVSQSSVSKYMVPRRGRPSQTWLTFVRNQSEAIAAVDMFTVRTLSFECLHAFVVLSHHRRRILHTEAASHANALWLGLQIANAARGADFRILVRDNDGAYGLAFRDALRRLGLDDRPTQPHSPWQNGHVERLIGSIRRECLDHQIILNAAHLRRVLKAYAEYYNRDRTHLALAKNSPHVRDIERSGRLHARPILGGLHHRYVRKPRK